MLLHLYLICLLSKPYTLTCRIVMLRLETSTMELSSQLQEHALELNTIFRFILPTPRARAQPSQLQTILPAQAAASTYFSSDFQTYYEYKSKFILVKILHELWTTGTSGSYMCQTRWYYGRPASRTEETKTRSSPCYWPPWMRFPR